jgi:hypothetical protein
VKQAPLIVLTDANMPAVLSEISFVNNPSDENLLLESGQRQRVAEGLYRGIAAFLDRLHSQPDKERKLVSETPASTSSRIAASTAQSGLPPGRIRRGPNEVQLPRHFCCNFFLAITEVLVTPF